MGATLVGGIAEFPLIARAVVAEVRQNWSDAWQLAPELEVGAFGVATAAHGLSECTLTRRLGSVKLPWEQAITAKTPLAGGANWWVRLSIVGPEGMTPVWMGRISGRARIRQAQQWQAYGAVQILHKIRASGSYWLAGGEVIQMGWSPDVNSRARHHLLLGNRSATRSGASFLFGGEDLWTNYDFVEYLLARYCDESGSGGPRWTLGGQAELLRDLTDSTRQARQGDRAYRVEAGQSVYAMLCGMIPPAAGIDWQVVPTDDGFEVSVYALCGEAFSWGGVNLPPNPNSIEVEENTRLWQDVRVTETIDHGYGTLRVIGGRIVVCCSLYGAGLEGHVAHPGTLVPKWDLEVGGLMADYLDPLGAGGTAAKNDEARRQERFQTVFQSYGAPAGWDHADVAPLFDGAGAFQPGSPAAHQNAVRTTLTWLPLVEGLDYSTDPPTDENPAAIEAGFRRPMVWLGKPWPPGLEGPFFFKFTPAEAASPAGQAAGGGGTQAASGGMHVSVAQHDWGILLNASPNHLLAAGHWPPDEWWLLRPTLVQPKWDYDYLAATIAFHTDQRIYLEISRPDAKPSDGVHEIEVPEAECWYLAPYTMVGVDAAGKMKTSGPQPRILRNDSDRLASVMAGAVARYFQSRVRAELVAYGLWPWGGLVGQILSTVAAQTGYGQWVGAPITSVNWSAGKPPRTTIRTGFASH